MDTLYLDPVSWDLTLDSSGNIALATNPYALAQEAANGIMTYSGEVYYDTSLGVPYFSQVLGQIPSLEWLRSQYIAIALTVHDVVSANVFFSGIVERKLTGQIQVTSNTGHTTAIGF